MNALRGVLAALALLLAETAFAAKPNARGISAWTQPQYTIYSHDAGKAREVAERMAIVDVVLSKFLRGNRRPDGMPTHIFIARDSIWNRYIRPSERIIGEFVPTRFSNYVLLNAYMSGEAMNDCVDHEYTHFYLRSVQAGQIPLWFDEGMAEFIESSELLRNSIKVGYPDVFRPARWITIERLLRIDKDSKEYLTLDTNLFHFQSWAFVHKALIEDRDFGRQMFAYLKAINDGTPIDEAVQRSFGMNVPALDQVLRAYSRRDKYRAGEMQFESPPARELGRGRELDEMEGLDLIARVMLDTGFNADRLPEVIALAKQLAPADSRVLILQLRMAVRNRNEAAIDALMKTLGPMTSDPEVSRAVGIALFEYVREELRGETPLQGRSLAEANRAFDTLVRAERTLPVDAEAAWAFGILAAALDSETAFALQRLELAQQAMPRHADLTMASALVHHRLKQQGEMIEALHKTARYARTAELREWALQRVDSVGRSRVDR